MGSEKALGFKGSEVVNWEDFIFGDGGMETAIRWTGNCSAHIEPAVVISKNHGRNRPIRGGLATIFGLAYRTGSKMCTASVGMPQ